VSPQAVKNELGPGVTVDDFVVENAETVTQAKSVNLYFQQSVNRFLDFVLYLTSQKTQRVMVSQENGESGSIPRF
jgi:hypothetical protein